MDPALREVIHMVKDPNQEITCLIKLMDARKYPQNIQVISQFGDIISCRLLRQNILSVYESKEVLSMKADRRIQIN